MSTASVSRMKINLSDINSEQFTIKEGVFCGKDAILVTPSLQGTEWSQDNLIFRSSVWDKDGNLISPSLKKFFNLYEKPGLNPTPNSLNGWAVHEKIDGSTLIATSYNKQIQIRSRGTFDARGLDNGSEFYELLNRFPEFSEYLLLYSNYSFIFEIVSPSQRIVIDYPELDFYLLHIIDKEDYSLFDDDHLDHVANLFDFKRPKRYSFEDFNSLVMDVQQWQESEGVVIRNDQHLVKIKSLNYLKLHTFKSDLSLKNLLEVYLDNPVENSNMFLDFIEKSFDFECKKMCEGIVQDIFKAKNSIELLLHKVLDFTNLNKSLPRKEFALMAKNGLAEHCSLAFQFLDKNMLDKKTYKRLYYHYLNL